MSEEDHSAAIPRLGLFFLLGGILIAAACAIVYELLIGSISSYFMGDSVEQFSLTIGFFLFAMGLGSWLSRLIQQNLLARFISLEIWLGMVGGTSVAFLYIFYAYTDHYRYLMVVMVLVIGILIGLEVPLLARILRGYGPLRTTLSNVLSLDYLGSLVAALLFPYLLLPLLGGLHTGLVAGLVNLGVGLGVLLSFRHQLDSRQRSSLYLQGGIVGAALLGLLAAANPLLERWESSLYEDRIVHSEQSPYQKIVLTRWRDDLRLFLNGHLQFASRDQHRYHESLVHPAMSLASNRDRVLIIGGGDGLSASEVLKYKEVERIDLVDLDRAVTDLARRSIYMTRLNKNALNQPKVHIFNQDAFIFLQQEHVPYGVIILDLPDPREEALAKLYSVTGYNLCRRHLAKGGVLVTQASSPYFVRQAYWCVGATLAAAGLQVVPYHTWIPSFGEWGFHLASVAPLDLSTLDLAVPLRYLEEGLFQHMLEFDAEMAKIEVEPNRLDRPLLARFYRRGWSQW